MQILPFRTNTDRQWAYEGILVWWDSNFWFYRIAPYSYRNLTVLDQPRTRKMGSHSVQQYWLVDSHRTGYETTDSEGTLGTRFGSYQWVCDYQSVNQSITYNTWINQFGTPQTFTSWTRTTSLYRRVVWRVCHAGFQVSLQILKFEISKNWFQIWPRSHMWDGFPLMALRWADLSDCTRKLGVQCCRGWPIKFA